MNKDYLSKEISYVKCSNSESVKCSDCKFNAYHYAKGSAPQEDIPEFEELYQNFSFELNRILVSLELFSSEAMETKWQTSDVISQAKGILKENIEEACHSCMTADSSVFMSVTDLTYKIKELFEQGLKNMEKIESVISRFKSELKQIDAAGDIVKFRKEDKK